MYHFLVKLNPFYENTTQPLSDAQPTHLHTFHILLFSFWYGQELSPFVLYQSPPHEAPEVKMVWNLSVHGWEWMNEWCLMTHRILTGSWRVYRWMGRSYIPGYLIDHPGWVQHWVPNHQDWVRWSASKLCIRLNFKAMTQKKKKIIWLSNSFQNFNMNMITSILLTFGTTDSIHAQSKIWHSHWRHPVFQLTKLLPGVTFF